MELFKDSPAGRSAKARIEASDDAFTPSLVLSELAVKYLREGENPETTRRWLSMIAEATQVVDIDLRLAEESGKASMQLVKKASEEGLRKPGLGDAIVLATARILEAKLLTGDPHFKGLAETLWLGP